MEWRTLIQNSWLVGIVIFAVNFALKISTADFASLYLDEAVSVFYAQQDLAGLSEYVARDANPPLHYLLLHYWIKWFGIGETSVRGLSVLFSSGTAVIIWITLKRFANVSSAWIAVALFTFSSVHLHFAQEARGFALMTFLAAGSFWFYLRLLQDQRKWAAIGLAVANILLMYTHYAALFVPLMQSVGLIIWRDRLRELWLFWGGAQVLTVLALLPEWLSINAEKMGNTSKWLPPVDTDQLWILLKTFSGSNILLYLFGVLLVGGIVIWIMQKQAFPKLFALATLWFVGSLIAAFLLSFWVPVLLPKYLLFVSVGMLIMLALTIDSLPISGNVHLITVTLLIAFAASQFNYNQAKQEDWKGAVAWAEMNQRNGAVIMTAVYNYRAFSYHYNQEYFQDYENTIHRLYDDRILCTNEMDEEFFTYQPYDRFILIEAHEKDLPPDRKPKSVLSRKFELKDKLRVKGINLYLYEKN